MCHKNSIYNYKSQCLCSSGVDGRHILFPSILTCTDLENGETPVSCPSC